MPRFNIRVYGILIDKNNCILISDEFIRGDYFSKFPGGGLEFGEGTRDCLKREFKEETALDVIVGEHIYTTDFFQLSAFHKDNQIISIYYFVHSTDTHSLQTKIKIFDFSPEQIKDPQSQSEVLRWVEWNDLNEESVSLPIDKVVVSMLKKML